jgi:hypothetical protein
MKKSDCSTTGYRNRACQKQFSQFQSDQDPGAEIMLNKVLINQR